MLRTDGRESVNTNPVTNDASTPKTAHSLNYPMPRPEGLMRSAAAATESKASAEAYLAERLAAL